MRFAFVVLLTALVASAAFQSLENWVGSGAMLRSLFLGLAAFGAGALVRKKHAAAGFLAIALAPVLAALLSYLRRSADPAADEALGFLFGLVLFALPYAVMGAVAGSMGGLLRRKLLSPLTGE